MGANVATRSNRWSFLTERIPERLTRLLKSFERMQIFWERMSQPVQTGGDFNRMDTRTARTAAHAVRTDAKFLRTDVATRSNGWWFYPNGYQNGSHGCSSRSNGCSSLSNGYTSRSNGWETASERNSVRKRELVSVRFPVKGHKWFPSEVW